MGLMSVLSTGFLCGKVRLAVCFVRRKWEMRIFVVGKWKVCNFGNVVRVQYVQFAMAVVGVDDSERRMQGDFDTAGVDDRLTEVTWWD